MSEDDKDLYCTAADWLPCLPDELKHITQAQWEARSRLGSWIHFERVLNRKGVARYLKTDCVEWFDKAFGVSHPHCLQMLFDRGFPRMPATKKARAKS